MTDGQIILLCGCIVLTTFTVEGIAGFGSTVMALPFVALILGVEKAVPLLSSCSVLLSLFIVCRARKQIDWRQYGFIVLHVGLGVPIGLALMDVLPKVWLLSILAGFMFFTGIRGLLTLKRASVPETVVPSKGGKNLLYRFILFCGGIIQGAFSSGGPLVVMYASKAIVEKSAFRATLSMLWVTTNLCMIGKWICTGNITRQTGGMIFALLPFVVGGALLGNFLHNKVNQFAFRVLVWTVLIIAGGILVLNLCAGK